MKRERMPLSRVAEIGDRIVADHTNRCRDDDSDPASMMTLMRTMESVEGYLPDNAVPIELRAVTTYVSASLGHERKRRPRMMVWWDRKGGPKDDKGRPMGTCRYRPPPWLNDREPMPPVDEMLTYTIEDVEREQAA